MLGHLVSNARSSGWPRSPRQGFLFRLIARLFG